MFNALTPESLPDLTGGIKTPREWQTRSVKLLDLLYREEYGYPAKLSAAGSRINAEGTGKDHKFISAVVDIEAIHGCHALELHIALPDTGGLFPAFVYISFKPADEELIGLVVDSGFALCTLCYKSVTSDDDDMTNGLSGAVYGSSVKTSADRQADGCGKIMLWAQSACIAAKWLSGQPYIDASKIAVIGHSRLGKTALLAGAMCDVFEYVISNNSGCSGAAITRNKRGERIGDITKAFPFWFCKNYAAYSGRESELPFDQHFLIGLTAPRRVLVGSAQNDIWADPHAEYLACAAASQAWEIHGLPGLKPLVQTPKAGDLLHGGEIGYHLRAGEHKLKLEDWEKYIKYIKAKNALSGDGE